MREYFLFFLMILHASAYADESINKVSDYKKMLIQFMKPVDLQLSQFVRDTGRSSSAENKSPNYRLLFESTKLQGAEENGARVSCTVYQKTILSNRAKNYADESIKFEKTITEKIPVTISSDIQWTITKAQANDLGYMLWVSGDKKSMQIDCEKKNAEGKEVGMHPKEVFSALSANEVQFFKDGNRMKPEIPKTDEVKPAEIPPQ